MDENKKKDILDKIPEWAEEQKLKDYDKIIKDSLERRKNPEAFDKKQKIKKLLISVAFALLFAEFAICFFTSGMIFYKVFILKSDYDMFLIKTAIGLLHNIRFDMLIGIAGFLYFGFKNIRYEELALVPCCIGFLLCFSLLCVVSMLVLPRYEVLMDGLIELELLSQTLQ